MAGKSRKLLLRGFFDAFFNALKIASWPALQILRSNCHDLHCCFSISLVIFCNVLKMFHCGIAMSYTRSKEVTSKDVSGYDRK